MDVRNQIGGCLVPLMIFNDSGRSRPLTDLYRISIDRRTGATLHGRVHISNPDAEEVPAGRDFPLRMIIEVWHRTREGFFFTGDRLHRDLDEAAAIAEQMELKGELERLQGLDNGVKHHITEQDGEEIIAARKIEDDEQRELAEQALIQKHGIEFRGADMSDGTWYITGKRDPEAFYERACEIITDYQVGETHNWPPHWELTDDEYSAKFGRRELELADYPYAEFTFTVKDADYLEHIDGGIHFSTTIYGEFD
ncbi:MAG: hypothetical protein ACRD0P_37045 [Stackebrandtia sp.]